MIIPGENHPLADTISLLQCILEQCQKPKHFNKHCDTNNCPACVYEVYQKELEAPYKPKAADGKAFPMLDEPREIPWALGLAIWETLYNPLYHDQTAVRIAERGGFGWKEVQLMAKLAYAEGRFGSTRRK